MYGFESLTGCSHGPMWFRKAQVALKVLLFVCSICVGLSVNAFQDDFVRLAPLPGRMVLIRRERRMAQLGIGNPPIIDKTTTTPVRKLRRNFSSDVMFVRAAQGCLSTSSNASSGVIKQIYLNASTSENITPEQYTFRGNHRCASELIAPNPTSSSPIRVLETENLWESMNRQNLLECDPALPSLSTIKSGVFNITLSKCPWRLTQFYCQATYRGSCAMTLDLGDHQVLRTADYNFRESPAAPQLSNYKSWRRRDAENVQIAAMYVDSGLGVSPDQMDFITSFQAGEGTITERTTTPNRIGTQIDPALFLPGLFSILEIVLVFIMSSLVSHVVMLRKKRSAYALGLCIADVARFCQTDGTSAAEGKLLFLKLHPDFPSLQPVEMLGIEELGPRKMFWEQNWWSE